MNKVKVCKNGKTLTVNDIDDAVETMFKHGWKLEEKAKKADTKVEQKVEPETKEADAPISARRARSRRVSKG